jgi:hypothetical protein
MDSAGSLLSSAFHLNKNELICVVSDAEDKLKGLYKLVKDGVDEIDEILKDRLNSLKAERNTARAALERAKASGVAPILIDPALLERFGRNMREKFTSGSPSARLICGPSST